MSDMTMTTSPTTDMGHGYDEFRAAVQRRFLKNLSENGNVLFETDADGVWSAFLENLPDEHRQQYNCHCCRSFFRKYGGLAVIDENLAVRSAMWDQLDAPAFFRAAVREMSRIVAAANVVGPFKAKEATWGTPETKPWTHFFVTPTEHVVHKGVLQTAGQWMAEKREDFKNVFRAIREFPSSVVAEAMRVVESDALYRTENVEGPARFLHDLHAALSKVRNAKLRDHILLLAVAKAPAGFCHPRSSMVGTLLEDIAAGMTFEQVSRRFADKMHPLRYQRPQAAPSAGNIARAEEIVRKLGIERSLNRRFATVEELPAIWRPKAAEAKDTGEGVFGHLKPKGVADAIQPLALPPTTMTWVKFAKDVLPDAEAIELMVPSYSQSFAPIVTAADPDAPPILQWDRPEARNPFSWYFWHGGTPASHWGLSGGSRSKVQAIMLNPSMSGADDANGLHGRSVFLILDGARERRQSGNALFPEILKSELREVRSTIEAYSRTADIDGMDRPHAVGFVVADREDKGEHARLRVTSKGGVREYLIDRWD